jgi:DNA polymerase/3'-5' exonuclease PolX
MNKNLIYEFEKLLMFVKDELDLAKSDKNKEAINKNSFRLRQFNKVISILKKYPEKITLKNIKEFNLLPGIGKGTINRIKEILEKGYLDEVKDYNPKDLNKNKIISELEEIIGVGRTNAVDLYNQGVLSISDLRKKIKSKKIEVNDKILLGLKYHGIIKTNIPRKEMEKINKMLGKVVNHINKKYRLTNKNKYCYQICGSYRREKEFSNDIDILLTKYNTKSSSKNNDKHLERFVSKLKTELSINNGQEFLIDDMTDKNITTKYMGFCKYKNNPVRRIDIRYVSYDSYYSALLYFTGSGEFNKNMRNIAKEKGYKLSEYGIFDENNKKIKVTSEEDFFKILKMDYVNPKYR